MPTTNSAAITWTTDEPSNSRVDYGTSATSLTQSSTNAASVTSHTVSLTGLQPNTTYFYRVTSTDAAGNSATSPATPESFSTALVSITDTTAANFGAGQAGTGSYVAQTDDGEVSLAPAAGSEFGGSSLPSGWTSTAVGTGGAASVSGGVLRVNGAFARTSSTYGSARSLEFVATFVTAANQAAGLGTDLSGGDVDGVQHPHRRRASASTVRGERHADEHVARRGFLGTPHRFRIDWTASSIRYSVDGVVVATHAVAITSSLRPIATAPRVARRWPSTGCA